VTADTLEAAQAPLRAPLPGAKAGKKPPPLWRVFIVFLAPLMLSNVLQSLSGTINSVFLGHLIGVEALAAATVFFPLMFFFIAFVIGLGMGASILIGQAFGRGDIDRVRAVAGSALSITLFVGIIIAVAGGLYAEPLMIALRTPENIIADATEYARIMLISMPVMFVFILATSMLRGVGDTVTPLYALIFSTLIGVIITPALIQGWFGLPKLGVASAAVASLIATVLGSIWLAHYLLRRKHTLAPNLALLKHLWIDWKVLGKMLHLGVPTGIQMVIIAIAELVVLGLANSYGSNATAAYGTINQILAYVQFPAISIGITASILGAQAIGGGRASQLGAITRTGLMLNFIITGAGVTAVYLLAHPIVAMFITDPAVVDMTEHLLGLVLWSVVIFGMAVVFSSVMRSSGTVLAPTAISITAILAVEVPVAWYLSRWIGIDGVWIAYPVAFTAMMLMQAAFYMMVWRKRTIRALI
jgi:putative MATE family efflux protein